MEKSDYENLSVVFYDFHFLSEGDLPGQEPIFCFLVLVDGTLTAARWHQFIFKEEHNGELGEFVRGLADAIPMNQVHAWLNLEKWHFDPPKKGEEIFDRLTIGSEKEYSIEVKGFHSIKNKEIPQNAQYCFLLLKNGKMSGGRWSDGSPYLKEPGYFDHATGGSIISVGDVWLWAALDPDKEIIPKPKPQKISKTEKKKPEEENKSSEQPPKPSKAKFGYGLNMDVYLDKAVEKLQQNFAWVTRNHLDPRYRYAIEVENGKYEYVEYYKDDRPPKRSKSKRKVENKEKREILTGYLGAELDAKGFIHHVIFHNEFYVISKNKVIARHNVKFRRTHTAGGWHLEHYIFMKHATGDYTVDIQAGDRNTGANREFGIPRKCFEEPTFDRFLDEYEKIVPGDFFGLSKEDLIADEKLKAFLGYTE